MKFFDIQNNHFLRIRFKGGLAKYRKKMARFHSYRILVDDIHGHSSVDAARRRWVIKVNEPKDNSFEI